MQDDLTLPDGAVRIPLRARDGSIRTYAIVDAADAEWVNQRTWHLDEGYAKSHRSNRDGRRVHVGLHRELLGLAYGDPRQVDHRDRNRLNCRRANLRVIPKMGNRQNKSSARGSSSQHRGVSWQADRGLWGAWVKVNDRSIRVGSFASEAEAAEAVRQARLRLMVYALD